MSGGTAAERAERRRFLFRSEDGVIDAPTWRFHAGWLAALLLALTLVWLVLRPYAHHDLSQSAFLAPLTIIAFAYLIIFTFAVLLIAISFTMLSMKRLRDRREPVGLGGLVPLLALFAGALHFLQPQATDVISWWYLVITDVALAAAIVWTVVDCGFKPGRGTSGP